MDPCLTEDVVAALVDGSLDDARFSSAEKHIAECERCMRLVEEVGRALSTHGDAADRMPPLVAGARVGRYEILEPIGAGGMGRVYAALDPALDRRVALKLLHPSSTTADLEARLLREAKAMARLSHPEVITVHDVGHYGRQLFIAMELVDGGTLRQWLAAADRSWKEVLDVFLRAGRGLARAHAAGIVHRDFKADNVLVSSEGRVRVTDFGLARTVDAVEPQTAATLVARPEDPTLTRTGSLMGTPAYMAPEQHEGAPADARSDLYSFCVALYEGLCGERPFVARSVGALVAQKKKGPPSPRRGKRRVPPRLLRAVERGLQPEPAQRYASVDELLAALERSTRAPRWPFALGAAAIVAAGAGAALGARRARPVHGADGAVAKSVGCTSSSACSEAHGGQPFVCRAADRACVAVASEDCVAQFEPQDLAGDDTVWLGALFPRTGPAADDFGKMNLDALDFARREVAAATKAFDGSTAAQRLRRVALVECEDGVDAARAARHLVDDVGVPAIVGFRSGQEVVDLAESLLIRRDVLAVATVTSSPLITRLPQPSDRPRMVWRTTYNLDAVAAVAASVVEGVLEPRGAPGSTRVTLLRSDVAGARSFAEKLYAQLRFNGKSAVDNASAYAEVTFPPGERSAADIEGLAGRVAATRPTIVVLQGELSTVASVIAGVEARMVAPAHGPTYLGALYSPLTFASFIGTSADRRRRLLTIESLSNATPNARFVLRYNEAHDAKVTRTLNGGASYDAFWLLAYATFASGSGAIDGPALARAFSRLVGPGDAVEVGPSGLFDALTTLGKGGKIDLQGTQSGLDLDLATGDEPSDFEVLCFGADAQGRSTGEDVESGLVFRASTHKLEGALRCP